MILFGIIAFIVTAVIYVLCIAAGRISEHEEKQE